MKIAIYGDSFGNSMLENCHNDFIDRGKSWAEILEEKYEVANFCQAGSSLFYSYKLFLENNKNFDYNIFLVTESNRITLPDEFDILPLTKHINLSFVNAFSHRFSSKLTNDSRLDHIISAIESYYSFIHNEQVVDIFHNLMIENINRINQNTIIIPCFDQSIPNTQVSLNSICAHEFKESKIMQTLLENGCLSWKIFNDENGKWTYSDYRKCHLNEENNKKLFEIIVDAINNKQQTINIDLNQFSTATKDIEYYHYLIKLDKQWDKAYSNETRLNGELHNLYNKLLIDIN